MLSMNVQTSIFGNLKSHLKPIKGMPLKAISPGHMVRAM